MRLGRKKGNLVVQAAAATTSGKAAWRHRAGRKSNKRRRHKLDFLRIENKLPVREDPASGGPKPTVSTKGAAPCLEKVGTRQIGFFFLFSGGTPILGRKSLLFLWTKSGGVPRGAERGRPPSAG